MQNIKKNRLMVCVYQVFAWNNDYLEAGVGYALRIVFTCDEET